MSIPVLSTRNYSLSGSEEENNNYFPSTRKQSRRSCLFCLRRDQTFTEEEHVVHLRSHYDSLFRCGVCQLGFQSWKEAVSHLAGHRGKLTASPVLPAKAEHLLTATCRFKKCRKVFVGLSRGELEQHLFSNHWKSRKKGGQAVDWSCRMCNNGGRVFRGYSAALTHAELHKAGLIVSARPDDIETDSSDGGFTSGSDCLSEEEEESDLSSVSERETDHDSDNAEGKEEDSGRKLL